jgi:hypothetical protein
MIMSRKLSIGASVPQGPQHVVTRDRGMYRRLRVAVFSIGVLFLLPKFFKVLTGPLLLDIHIDRYSDEVDPEDIWDEVSQCCLVVPCVFRVRELDKAEGLY